jgi:hypothetical protein
MAKHFSLATQICGRAFRLSRSGGGKNGARKARQNEWIFRHPSAAAGQPKKVQFSTKKHKKGVAFYTNSLLGRLDSLFFISRVFGVRCMFAIDQQLYVGCIWYR